MKVRTTDTTRSGSRPRWCFHPTPSPGRPWTGRSSMAGRVVFVTGGTRGIGAAISKSFASQGAIIAAGYSQGLEHAQKFLAELELHEGHGSIHQGNVGSSEDCRPTIAEVIDTHGPAHPRVLSPERRPPLDEGRQVHLFPYRPKRPAQSDQAGG